MEFESILNNLNTQRKKTLKSLDLMEHLIDFDAISKNPAKKKVATQTVGSSNSNISVFGLSDTLEGKDLIPFAKYFQFDKNLIYDLKSPPV
jgi:hypothetical protein